MTSGKKITTFAAFLKELFDWKSFYHLLIYPLSNLVTHE